MFSNAGVEEPLKAAMTGHLIWVWGRMAACLVFVWALMYSVCLRSREESSQTILAAGIPQWYGCFFTRHIGAFCGTQQIMLCDGYPCGHLTKREVKLFKFLKTHWWKWSSWNCPPNSYSMCVKGRSWRPALSKDTTHGNITVEDTRDSSCCQRKL